MGYKIVIEEMLRRVVEVEAESPSPGQTHLNFA